MCDRSRDPRMILEEPTVGLSRQDCDGFLVRVAEQRGRLEREHGEPWVAVFDDPTLSGERPTRLVVRFVPASDRSCRESDREEDGTPG